MISVYLLLDWSFSVMVMLVKLDFCYSTSVYK